MSMKKLRFVFLPLISLLIAVLIYFYFTNFFEFENSFKIAKEKCIEICKKAKERGVDLSRGPCLSDNNPEWKLENWVCDVAHWPRIEIDNLRENQCKEWWKAYLAGKEIHFIEVDENCNFIRSG